MTTGAETAQAEIDRLEALKLTTSSVELIAEFDQRIEELTKIVNRAEQ